MAKIEYNRDRGNYLEIYDHESLNDMREVTDCGLSFLNGGKSY